MKRKQQATEYMILIMMAIGMSVISYFLSEFIFLVNEKNFLY
ncbi:hypothetical protein [Arcobacter sp. FWKO B]|nr:hypothetical protein [Arcobacter sp. FWKO B]